MPTSHDYYKILGVPQGAGAAEVKAAYRELAMKYHPDQNPSPDAHKQFVAINAAHSVLSDPFKRKLYDLRRQAGKVIYTQTRSARPYSADSMSPEEMRRRYWASPAGQQKIKQSKKDAEFFNKSHAVAKILSIPILLFMLLFLVERFFPEKILDQEIVFVKKSQGKGIYKLGHYPVRVQMGYVSCLKIGDKVDVYLGRVFKLVVRVASSRKCSQSTYSADAGDKSFVFIPSGSIFGGLIVFVYLGIISIAVVWFSSDSETGSGAFIFAFGMTCIVLTLFARLFI